MENYQSPEKFYELMKQKTVEILSLDIPAEEREKSLDLVKETIRRYEQISRDKENGERALKELDKGLNEFLGICGKIDRAISTLEKTTASTRRFVEDWRRSQKSGEN